MTNTKISSHLFHQEFFDRFNRLDRKLQTAVLEVTPSDPSVVGLCTEAPREWTVPEILTHQKVDWISRLGQVFDRRARLERERRRFVPFPERECISVPGPAWSLVMTGNWGAGMHYKGLLNVKSPMDLALYSMLIWEQKPRTIIEFGSLQGGSALWFADQMQSQLGAGAVHSFDINPESVSPRAQDPFITYHRADLRDPATLDQELFRNLPHPWLVIDDAHTNVFNVLDWVGQFMTTGDYYVIEDVSGALPPDELARLLASRELLVDTFYCDNFGYNCTISPNGWLRRM